MAIAKAAVDTEYSKHKTVTMDGLKLERWRKAFEDRVQDIRISYDAFLLPKKFEEVYRLEVAGTAYVLSLWMDTESVPAEIQHRLELLLAETEPEDSI